MERNITFLCKELRLLRKILLIIFFIVYLLGYFCWTYPSKPDCGVLVVKDGIFRTYLAIDRENRLYGWGSNDGGLVENWNRSYFPYPVRKLILPNAETVYTNLRSCAMAIDQNHVLWGWGRNGNLLLLDEPSSKNKPVKIMENVISAGIGYFHAAAVTEDGSLWVWGQNSAGELGLGYHGDPIKKPVRVMDHIASVRCFYDMTFAITRDHDLYLFGSLPSSQSVVRPRLIARNIQEVSSLDYSTYQLETPAGKTYVLDLSPFYTLSPASSASLAVYLEGEFLYRLTAPIPAVFAEARHMRLLLVVEFFALEAAIVLLTAIKKNLPRQPAGSKSEQSNTSP